MGASESTARTNGTNREEEDRQQQSGGIGDGAAVAITAVGVAAWGISRMLSNNNTETRTGPVMESPANSRTNNNQNVSFPTRMISWSPPPVFRFKMNTDAGCRPYYQGQADDDVMRGPSGYGGILRDHRGKWVRGFLGFIGSSDCLTAEFHGIYNGLLLLDKLGMKEAILESDSVAAVDWITKDQNSNSRPRQIINNCWEMIVDCKNLVLKNKISVRSCCRDANKCADKLADMAIDKRLGYKLILDVPDEIKYLVNQESQTCFMSY